MQYCRISQTNNGAAQNQNQKPNFHNEQEPRDNDHFIIIKFR